MKFLAKILGSIIGVFLYPFWMLERILVFVADIFEVLEYLMEDDK